MFSDTKAYKIEDNEVSLSAPNYGIETFTSSYAEEYEEDSKYRKAYIRDIEKLVRRSDEYERWRMFLESALSVDFQCYHTGLIKNICKIHVHHHPYTLYDLCDIVMSLSTQYTTFDIAKQVMKLHFLNLVGFVPLCATSHESYHSGMLAIPIEIVEGNWRELPDYIDVPKRISRSIERKVSCSFENECDPNDWAVKTTQFKTGECDDRIKAPRHVNLRGWD